MRPGEAADLREERATIAYPGSGTPTSSGDGGTPFSGRNELFRLTSLKRRVSEAQFWESLPHSSKAHLLLSGLAAASILVFCIQQFIVVRILLSSLMPCKKGGDTRMPVISLSVPKFNFICTRICLGSSVNASAWVGKLITADRSYCASTSHAKRSSCPCLLTPACVRSLTKQMLMPPPSALLAASGAGAVACPAG